MNRQKLIALIREERLLEQLEDGPVSLLVSVDGKQQLLCLQKRKDHLAVTTGRWMRRTLHIPLSELTDPGKPILP